MASIESILCAMGAEKTVVMEPEAAYQPRSSGVGEFVWDPTVSADRPRAHPVVQRSSVAVEMLRARALRRLQAAIEEAFLDELGDSVCARLAIHSRVTLRVWEVLV